MGWVGHSEIVPVTSMMFGHFHVYIDFVFICDMFLFHSITVHNDFIWYSSSAKFLIFYTTTANLCGSNQPTTSRQMLGISFLDHYHWEH